jgi:transposase
MDDGTTGLAGIESAHTSGHKSARNARIELITRGERRRRWTAEEKQAIAAQSLSPGASPSEVARLYGISTGQLYTWRRAFLAAQPELSKGGIGPFARVEMVAARPSGPAPAMPSALCAPSGASARTAGAIEIVLRDGTMVRVDARVDAAALGRVLSVLRG